MTRRKVWAGRLVSFGRAPLSRPGDLRLTIELTDGPESGRGVEVWLRPEDTGWVAQRINEHAEAAMADLAAADGAARGDALAAE